MAALGCLHLLSITTLSLSNITICAQVGGRLGYVFDEDPRRWRMIAVGFATVGLALEIATAAFPANFLALAGAGNFTKALGKGLSQPCFRIIQTHFASNNNVGDISAKEEVSQYFWRVYTNFLTILLLKI